MNARTFSFGMFFLVVFVLALVVLSSGLYTLDETQQGVVLQFGEPVGEPVTEAGLHWKTPFIQEVSRYFAHRFGSLCSSG